MEIIKMKKVLLLSLLCLSFNSFAKDVQDMTKAEATIKHKELHAEVMKNADNSIELKSSCENFNEFRKSAAKHKKIDLLDMERSKRYHAVSDVCDAKGYSLSY